MLVLFFRWIIGYVGFEIKGKYPERFINIVTKKSLSIWNIKKSDDAFFACMYIKDYKHIRPMCRKSRVKLRVTSRNGFPFCIKKYKNRVGVVIGVLVFVVAVYVMSCFVWTIEITGLESISKSELLYALEENGLYVGVYKDPKGFQTVSRNTMLDIDKIGWMAINVSGSHACVEVKEKAMSPRVENTGVPANIKARCDGLITKINVKSGRSYFEKGSAVVKDQLLVSGVVEDKLGGVTLLRADADVIALTSHELNMNVNKVAQVSDFDNVKERKNLKILWFDIPLSYAFADEDQCVVRFNESKLCVNDTYLPVALKSAHLYKKESKNTMLTTEKAKKLFETKAMLYRCFSLRDAKVLDIKYSFSETEDSFVYNVVFECEENIAYKQEIDAKDLEVKEETDDKSKIE